MTISCLCQCGFDCELMAEVPEEVADRADEEPEYLLVVKGCFFGPPAIYSKIAFAGMGYTLFRNPFASTRTTARVRATPSYLM